MGAIVPSSFPCDPHLTSPDFCLRLAVIITYSPDLSPHDPEGADPRVTDSLPSVP